MDNQQVPQPQPMNPQDSANSGNQGYAPTQPPASVQPVASSPLSSPKTSKIPRWLKVIGVVVIVIIILFVGFFVLVNQSTKNAVKVSNQFVADVQSNNDNAAYNLTTASFQQVDTEAQLSQIISGVSPALQGTAKVTGKTINKNSGQPDEAIVVYGVQTSAGTKYIRVVLQDNKTWQVLNFRSSDTPLSDTSAN